MNNQRRKAVKKIVAQLQELQGQISELAQEEEQYLENMPESLLESDRAQQAEEAISSFEYADQAFEELCSNLEDVIQ